MSTLLYITAHPLTEEKSSSLATGKAFLNAYRSTHPDDAIEELNLYQENVPVIDAVTFSAWGKLRKGTPLMELTDEEQAAVKWHDKLSDQFIKADKYVFVNPMWNHFMPPILKSYLDTLCVAGKTFRYTAQGPVGLLTDKKVLHIQSAGGLYDRSSDAVKDFGHAYLEHIMAFFGIHEVQSVFVEGADAHPAEATAIREKATAKAVRVAEMF